MAKCGCFRTENGKTVCYGTKEREVCSCDGAYAKCDFYPKVRKAALEDVEKPAEGKNKLFKAHADSDSIGQFVSFIIAENETEAKEIAQRGLGEHRYLPIVVTEVSMDKAGLLCSVGWAKWS